MPLNVEALLRRGAVEVMGEVGVGHSEGVYHECLRQYLERKGVPYRSQVPCPVLFQGRIVGVGYADLVVGQCVVELKANRGPPSKAAGQLRKYTESLTRIEGGEFTGMVLNFDQGTGKVVEYSPRVVESRFFHKPKLLRILK